MRTPLLLKEIRIDSFVVIAAACCSASTTREDAMAKYFLSWEIDRERMADDPKTIASGWKMLAAQVRADLESGKTAAWGSFPGSLAGYSVIEGNEMDVMRFTMQYAPYVSFEVRPMVGIGEVEEFLAAAAD
jgi:hypothetical protein